MSANAKNLTRPDTEGSAAPADATPNPANAEAMAPMEKSRLVTFTQTSLHPTRLVESCTGIRAQQTFLAVLADMYAVGPPYLTRLDRGITPLGRTRKALDASFGMYRLEPGGIRSKPAQPMRC